MKVFKFGGASLKDANGVKNVAAVLQQMGYSNTWVVVSAMGKTTNALEDVVQNYFKNPDRLQKSIDSIDNFHTLILNHLFENKDHPVYTIVNALFSELALFLKTNKSPNHSFVYDQVVGYGELIASTIVSQYLKTIGIKNQWVDARTLIKTDTEYRNANVDWDSTQNTILAHTHSNQLTITQGFLGSDTNNFTTTLGREGSDYTAAIFAYCLDADSVTIWKDVDGVLNADPRYFTDTQLLHHISYREAIELAFYGASVIHPKTLQPLQGKAIPLYVKSFLNPKAKGTRVSNGKPLDPEVPCFIVKKNQVLIALSSLDFSYIVEENISDIFSLLHLYKMKVDLIQNSAISFSVCFDSTYGNLEKLIQHLKAKFKVTCYDSVNLYTIRHFNTQALKTLEKDKTILLKQLTQQTVQIVTV